MRWSGICCCFILGWGLSLSLPDKVYAQDSPVFLSKQTGRAINAGSEKDEKEQLAQFRNEYHQSIAGNNNKGAAESLISLASYYFYREKYEQSIELLNEAVDLAKKDKLHKHIAKALMFKGATYTNLGFYEQAMQQYLEALNYIDSNNPESKGEAFIFIASLLLHMNKGAEALTYLNKAEPEIRKGNNLFLLSCFYLNKGDAYGQLDYNDKSLDSSDYYIGKAMKMDEQLNMPILKEEGWVLMARNAYARGNYSLAIDRLDSAASLGTIANTSKIEQLILRGKCYLEKGEKIRALSAYEKAEGLAMQNSRFLLPKIYEELQKLYRTNRNYERALHYAELFRMENDRLMGDKIKARINGMQLAYETARRDRDIADKALMIEQQKKALTKKNIIVLALVSLLIILTFAGWSIYKYRQRKQLKRNREALWRATLKGEENERTRLAQHLHDSIGGSLSTAFSYLDTIVITEVAGERQKSFAAAKDLVEDSIIEIRNMAHHLMPELVLKHGLIKALQIYCNNIRRSSDIDISFQYLGYTADCEKGLTVIVYRIVQELLRNVVKHSGASNAMVQLSFHEGILMITVEDNGKGIENESDVVSNPGMGLMSVRQSVAYLNGQFSVESSEGRGTAITIELHLENIGGQLP